MTEVKITTLCDHCGRELPENFLPNESCPNCGHKGRTSHIDITENINISKEERLDLYAFEGIVKIPESRRQKEKQSKWRTHISEHSDSQNRSIHRERIFDRENNRYKEIVKDRKTQENIHSCDEPLTAHQGHGSAKKKP